MFFKKKYKKLSKKFVVEHSGIILNEGKNWVDWIDEDDLKELVK